jgi:WD40 repeat protein
MEAFMFGVETYQSVFFDQLIEYKGHSLISELKGHRGTVNCLAGKGNLVVSGADDGTLRVWDLVIIMSHLCHSNIILR